MKDTAYSYTCAAATERAIRAVPPVWPLATSVAVNPYLGQSDLTLAQAAARLERVAGAPMTMPRAWYAERIADGRITEADLAAALAATRGPHVPAGPDALRAAALQERPAPATLPTLADLAAEATGMDWPAIIAHRIGAWAAGQFDEGQALWAAPQRRGPYSAWRATASHDLTPEIAGLSGFAAHAEAAPTEARDAIVRAAQRLALPEAALELYFHRLLMTLGGWSQYARYLHWQAELSEKTDASAVDLLAIRMIWEEALLLRFGPQIGDRWEKVVQDYARPAEPDADHVIDAILQTAAERAAQREIAGALAQDATPPRTARPALQAAFCIDVRSEVFRRSLEAVAPDAQTIGFAGFFGLPLEHRGFASDIPEAHLPVLLRPALKSRSGNAPPEDAETAACIKARGSRAWNRFKFAAVSSFAFVEAAGPIYVGKLLRDALGLPRPAPEPEPAPVLNPDPGPEARVDLAEQVLRAMSLTGPFARVVLLAGHGASAVNNPHLSALHCGACGGHTGAVSARVLAGLLNDQAVREGLRPRGLDVPGDTLFLGALHDTTTDEVTLFEDGHAAPGHEDDLRKARGWLAQAGKLARTERALRLPRAAGPGAIEKRSRDWAETRPEWALAGCRAFIAAPRHRTAGKALNGRAFLHDYDWRQDRDFGVLELILTAPVVVASWISLQYYGSTVAPDVFGGGNKLLHNVTGGIGVVEGNGGVLRAGLPWQSVHNGNVPMHEPLRLSVCIEAPCEAMNDILRRHASVRDLFDNGWLHLFALDEAGQMAQRYIGDLEWSCMESATEPRKLAS
ncbi:DUF2309 domain-containing protein [Marivita sp. GX14005]|uniref:YbcC family protein n=1 Tax=Marivita sp. GX14005 TaxID=2942276 RepID=UPI002019E022|nr:DUF2309 domain-containing protein [Marivita sp. GX14005]MCL3883103.1 DUF2309 domain-containing protein [Marivita sp. GX14005]